MRSDVQPDAIKGLLRGQPDWDAILEQAKSLGVETLLYAGLKQVDAGAQPPAAILEHLRHAYRRNAGVNLALMEDLKQLLMALSELEIPVIVLKGAALAELVYPGFGLRKMGDVDLLVRKADLDAVESLLQRLGCEAMSSDHEWFRNHHHITPYMSPTGSSVFEIHHHIHRQTPMLAVCIGDLWSRSRDAQIASVPARVLAPTDLVLHTCLHLAHDNTFQGQVRGLRDIAETIRRYGQDIDWRGLVDNCRQYGAQTYLYYALWAARDLAGAEVPPRVMTGLESALHPGFIKGNFLKHIIVRAILRDGPRSVFVRTCINQACAELLSSKRPSQKIKGFLEKVFREFRAGTRNRLPIRK